MACCTSQRHAALGEQVLTGFQEESESDSAPNPAQEVTTPSGNLTSPQPELDYEVERLQKQVWSGESRTDDARQAQPEEKQGPSVPAEALLAQGQLSSAQAA